MGQPLPQAPTVGPPLHPAVVADWTVGLARGLGRGVPPYVARLPVFDRLRPGRGVAARPFPARSLFALPGQPRYGAPTVPVPRGVRLARDAAAPFAGKSAELWQWILPTAPGTRPR